MGLREVSCDPGDWKVLAEDRDQWRDYVSMGGSPGDVSENPVT